MSKITVGKLEIINNEVNPTGLAELAMGKKGFYHTDESLRDFINTEYFGTSMGDGSFDEFIDCFPMIKTANQNDQMLFVGDEWYIIPFRFWDNEPTKKETVEDVRFWENLLTEVFEEKVTIEYEYQD